PFGPSLSPPRPSRSPARRRNIGKQRPVSAKGGNGDWPIPHPSFALTGSEKEPPRALLVSAKGGTGCREAGVRLRNRAEAV
ncbi:hypothetical protein QPX50_03330, partial [Corynebacterium accolens]|uniref:hypothetical protein n=1 Tax=Corynebacterium accolens TaxID=38284 RepID=UPI002542A503